MTSIIKKYARIRELKQNGTKVQVNESTPAGTRRCAHAKSPPQQISFEVPTRHFNEIWLSTLSLGTMTVYPS